MGDSSLHLRLEEFFQNFKTYKYKKRALILKSHDVTTNVFYIKSGFIRVFRISESGEELTLAILKPRDFFPLSYGIGTTSQSFYLEAITSLELWKAPQELFLGFVKKDPELFYELTERLLTRFYGILARIESMAFSNAYIKVATILLTCAEDLGENDRDRVTLRVPLTHKDIATMVGLTRETTSLEMKKLERKGLLKKHRNHLVITSFTSLKRESRTTSQPELVNLGSTFL